MSFDSTYKAFFKEVDSIEKLSYSLRRRPTQKQLDRLSHMALRRALGPVYNPDMMMYMPYLRNKIDLAKPKMSKGFIPYNLIKTSEDKKLITGGPLVGAAIGALAGGAISAAQLAIILKEHAKAFKRAGLIGAGVGGGIGLLEYLARK